MDPQKDIPKLSSNHDSVENGVLEDELLVSTEPIVVGKE